MIVLCYTDRMSTVLEALPGEGMSFNEALGFTVNQYVFAAHMTREQLGVLLGVSRTVAGKKLRGQVGWTAEDLARLAARFGVAAGDLLPRRAGAAQHDEAPAGVGGGAGPVPRTGFEPAAFCSEGRGLEHLTSRTCSVTDLLAWRGGEAA